MLNLKNIYQLPNHLLVSGCQGNGQLWTSSSFLNFRRHTVPKAKPPDCDAGHPSAPVTLCWHCCHHPGTARGLRGICSPPDATHNFQPELLVHPNSLPKRTRVDASERSFVTLKSYFLAAKQQVFHPRPSENLVAAKTCPGFSSWDSRSHSYSLEFSFSFLKKLPRRRPILILTSWQASCVRAALRIN